jgi:hypothetical protein
MKYHRSGSLQPFFCFQFESFATIEETIDCVFELEERIGDVLGAVGLPQFEVQEIEHFSRMGIALLSGRLVEGHHADAATLQSVHEGEDVSDLLLYVKGDVLESAEVEEGLHAEFFECRMLQHGDIKGVAVLGHQFAKVMGGCKGIEVAIDRVQVVYLILYFLHSFCIENRLLSRLWLMLRN